MISYVNGRYVPHRHGVVSIDDRVCQFGDAVYEVVAILQGRLIDEDLHLDRLRYSLQETSMSLSVPFPVLKMILRRILKRNDVRTGMVYIQVSRGVAPRDHFFPKNTACSLIVTGRAIGAGHFAHQKTGITVITVPDLRWKRRDIKTVNLLANCLAKQKAFEAGAKEAWMLDEEGYVTEGSSTNAWIVTENGELLTYPANKNILKGITRQAVLKLARENDIGYQERPFHLDEAYQAKEAFITSALSFVTPVVKINGKPCGNGKIGIFSQKLIDFYHNYIMMESATCL